MDDVSVVSKAASFAAPKSSNGSSGHGAGHNGKCHAHAVALAERALLRPPAPPPLPEPSLEEGIEHARDYLLSLQYDEGYWVGLLGNSDGTLCSDFIMMMHFLDEVDRVRQRKAIRHILRLRNSEGGWSLYPGGPSDITATAKAYFALKLAGHSPDEPALRAAREVVLRLGGLDAVNSYTKIYLALFGQVPWDEAPAIPPEILLLPSTFYFNIYEISSWSRAILVPLTILYAMRPVRPLPRSARIDELVLKSRHRGAPQKDVGSGLNWKHFFNTVDRLIKCCEWVPFKPVRQAALRKAEAWLLERCGPGGLGAVYPSMLNAIIALKMLGYPEDHPKLRLARAEFEALIIEDEETLHFQPCVSPIWDTAISAIAVHASGTSTRHPALQKAADWLLSKECRIRGDWSIRSPDGPAGGWFFEFHNEFYPDVDDTSMVLLALRRLQAEKSSRGAEIMGRAETWMLSMQNSDGGWGAFDRDNNKMVFTKVPFADHNALLDPSTSDITARVLESLGRSAFSRNHPAVIRAIDFIRRDQEPEGCWYGRWGVNYIYGTWQVLRGLAEIGENMSLPYVRRAADWLLSCQNPDGGWGESCESYENPGLKGRGESTPSQTAWALMGLLAAGYDHHPGVERGIQHLLREQRPDGGWDEHLYTGTGFPKVYYLEYTMYRHYFPLLALSDYRDRRKN